MTVTQLSVYVENKPGSLVKALNILSEENINIRAMSLADTVDFGLIRLIVSDVAKAKAALEKEAVVFENQVLAVGMDDRGGALNEILICLNEGHINIEYMYAFTGRQLDSAYVVMQVNDLAKAEKIFAENDIKTISDKDLQAVLG